jgi:hypothetical protein
MVSWKVNYNENMKHGTDSDKQMNLNLGTNITKLG